MDVEGFELSALKGATLTRKLKPDWFIEVHVGCGLEKFGGSVKEVLSYFPEEHYRLHALQPGETAFKPVSQDFESKSRFFLIALAR